MPPLHWHVTFIFMPSYSSPRSSSAHDEEEFIQPWNQSLISKFICSNPHIWVNSLALLISTRTTDAYLLCSLQRHNDNGDNACLQPPTTCRGTPITTMKTPCTSDDHIRCRRISARLSAPPCVDDMYHCSPHWQRWQRHGDTHLQARGLMRWRSSAMYGHYSCESLTTSTTVARWHYCCPRTATATIEHQQSRCPPAACRGIMPTTFTIPSYVEGCHRLL